MVLQKTREDGRAVLTRASCRRGGEGKKEKKRKKKTKKKKKGKKSGTLSPQETSVARSGADKREKRKKQGGGKALERPLQGRGRGKKSDRNGIKPTSALDCKKGEKKGEGRGGTCINFIRKKRKKKKRQTSGAKSGQRPPSMGKKKKKEGKRTCWPMCHRRRWLASSARKEK